MKPLLSVVVPVYGCESCLDELYRRLKKALRPLPLDHEILLVDDGSPGGAWARILALAARDPRVRGLRLSRNFGQHQAISAGLDQALGDYVVVMDCDLQDDPAEIPRLFAALGQGHDAVLALRSTRQDPWWKRQASGLFYRGLGYLTDTPLDARVANFGVYRASVIQAVRSMGDRTRFFPVMVRWVGFKLGTLEVAHGPRYAGGSSYSLRRLLKLGANVVLTFSNKPLRIIVNLGFAVSGLAAAYALYVLALAYARDITVPGWTSVIISMWFLSGIQMITGGIVGIYIGKIFDATKERPGYIVGEATPRRKRA
jgi:glycosyltransferase involved in cell wall biosynthesis